MISAVARQGQAPDGRARGWPVAVAEALAYAAGVARWATREPHWRWRDRHATVVGDRAVTLERPEAGREAESK